MHILFLTDNFPPEVNAPASRTYEHARCWVKAGHQVTVVTCAPNFPTGKVFKGYHNALWHTQEMDGIKVIRVWTFITANEGFLLRTLDYLSFMLMAMLISPFIRKVDVVIGTSPQFFTAIAAYVTSVINRSPFVFELRDLWPESIKAVGAIHNAFIIRNLERIEMFLYRRAAAIISVTNSFKSELIKRGIDGNKIHVITNGVDTRRFKQTPKNAALAAKLDLTEYFVGGYIGTHGLAHNLETIIDAASLLSDRNENDIKILFVGDGARKSDLLLAAKEKKLNNILFLDSVSKNEVVSLWSLLDVSIIHLKQTDLFKKVIPSKIFESMAMGIPLLHAVQGESAELVEHHGVGKVIPSDDPEAMAQALVAMKNDKKAYLDYKRKSLSVAAYYDRENLALKMLDALSHVLTR